MSDSQELSGTINLKLKPVVQCVFNVCEFYLQHDKKKRKNKENRERGRKEKLKNELS